MEPYFLTCIKSRVENSRNLYGQFQVGPFLPGDAVTMANSLRRSLLSEIYGVAITHVIMEGKKHEYSTVAGVRESVLDILLNVKQIVLTSNFQLFEPQIGFLQVQGPGIVRASDIKLPVSVQIVDPEQYIATLLYDGLLKIKFIISHGKNYILPHRRGVKNFEKIFNSPIIKKPSKKVLRSLKKNGSKKEKPFFFSQIKGITTKNFIKQILGDLEPSPFFRPATLPKKVYIPVDESRERQAFLENEKKQKWDHYVKYIEHRVKKPRHSKLLKKEDICYPVSVFPIDAVFMPINKVNFAIETADLSETPKDRVILEIWTNGSIHPKQAIHEAAKALIQLIAPLQEPKLFKNLLMAPSKFLKKKQKKKTERLEETEEEEMYRIASTIDIGNLNLSVRPYTCLKREKIENVADLLQHSSEDLLKFRNFGNNSLKEVKKILNQMGFQLRSQKIEKI